MLELCLYQNIYLENGKNERWKSLLSEWTSEESIFSKCNKKINCIYSRQTLEYFCKEKFIPQAVVMNNKIYTILFEQR